MMKWQIREIKWFKSEVKADQSQSQPAASEGRAVARHRRRRRPGSHLHHYCRLCRRYFRKYHVYALHRKSCLAAKQAKNDREETAARIVCKDCKLTFATAREVFRHRQYLDCLEDRASCASREDGDDYEEGEETDLSEVTDDEFEYDALYACSVCRSKFVSSQLLEHHRRRESHWDPDGQGRRPIELEDAYDDEESSDDFTFRSLGADEYSCTDCNGSGIVYHDPEDLLKHRRSAHSGLGPVLYCRYCASQLASFADFNDHHAAYHELQRYCRLCREYGRPESIGGGEEEDEDEGEETGPGKPLCLSCRRGLLASQSRDLLLPSDCLGLLKENLYCESCERVMPSLAHVRFHNCLKKIDEQPQQQSVTTARRLMPLPLLACPLCLESYNGLRSLYRHIIRHNDALAYKCNLCSLVANEREASAYSFDTWRALKRHARRCHSLVDLCVPRIGIRALRKSAEAVIERFVKNGVTPLI